MENNCEYIVSLGDFFDKPDLSSETITASKEITWSSIKHISIVGNHDASSSSLELNSVNSLKTDSHQIISEATILTLENCELCFLPYVLETDKKPLLEYFPTRTDKQRIILSHNDIMGIQLGPVMSRTGFSIEEIESNCDLFINGHLHNGTQISDKVINLGNLTGKDFGEDAFRYTHSVMLLDTDTLKFTLIENPYAYNFYKLYINTEADLSIFSTLKSNAVLSIKCESTLLDAVKQEVALNKDKIAETRIIIVKNQEMSKELATLDLYVDHIARFIDCCKATLDNTKVLEEELAEVCK
jgi:DNA repair exonuclease SbcCD nuclease subunit